MALLTRPNVAARLERRRKLGARLIAITPLAALLAIGGLAWMLLGTVVNRPAHPNIEHRDSVAASIRHDTLISPNPSEIIAAPGPQVAEPETVPAIGYARLSETRARLIWGISILFAALTIGTTLTAALLIVGIPTSVRSWRSLALALPVIPILLAWIVHTGGAWDFNETMLDSTVYHGTSAKYFVTGIETLAYSTLVALAVATGCILFRISPWPRPVPTPTAALRVSALARYNRRVRLLLYLGAAALVAGTLEVSALYSWAVDLLDNGAKDMPQAFGVLTGSFYSILLAAIFLPTFGVLRSQAQRLADVARPGATDVARHKWLTENAIEASLPKQLVSVFAGSRSPNCGRPADPVAGADDEAVMITQCTHCLAVVHRLATFPLHAASN